MLKSPIKLILFFLTFTCLSHHCKGQEGIVKGTISSKSNLLEGVEIKNLSGENSVYSDERGNFEIKIAANKKIKLKFSLDNYITLTKSYKADPNQVISSKIVLSEWYVTVSAKRNVFSMDPLKPGQIPSVMGNTEDLIKTQIGVNSSNELSSGYNVRGGNFDENLVYVEGVEVYRPFLARSGQQEGLSFTNSAMIDNIYFSAGGFEAKYGDKMSSVLDISYRKPTEFGGSVVLSLLGADTHFEGISKNQLWTYNTGIRYRSNGYLFNALPTKGEYKPVFADAQSRITYTRGNIEHSALFYGSLNKYRVVPETRESEFGTVNEALRLKIFFDGQEVSQFNTYMGAYTTKWTPNDSTELKFIASAFRTIESETFDIQGQYFLDELEKDISSEDFGESAFNRGVGTFINHARNELDASVISLAHKGQKRFKNLDTKWGVTYKHEDINDKISEWNMLDSAGYSIPNVSDSVGYTDPNSQDYQYLLLPDVVKVKNKVVSNRIMGYVQGTYLASKGKQITYSGEISTNDTTYIKDSTFTSNAYLKINAGVRSHFWSYNKQNVISPRASISLKPRWYHYKDSILLRRNVNFRLSGGLYYQPPFYREYRGFDGSLNPDIKAQQSVHAVMGADYVFYLWDRPFKYTAEVYYKDMNNLIPYEVDNVKLRYYATNNSNGYAYGIDMKLNGEFVEGIESWITLGWLKTEEDLVDDVRYTNYNSDGAEVIPGFTANDVVTSTVAESPGHIPRPTDQRFSAGLFFQDHMPKDWSSDKIKWETFSVNLNLIFGTGLPYGPPTRERWRQTLRSTSYRRIDIGFSKELITDTKRERSKDGSFFKKEDSSLKISVEVFNLLNVDNVVNYSWIQDVTGRNYAVPSYLTSRRLNIKMAMLF